jgi:ABC-type nitrate/sulfonate/bicarbonate transport system ATPase subunit
MIGELAVSDLTKRFTIQQGWGRSTELTVFDSLNLAVRAGEFVSVIGPSGCGKSTLLGIVAGLEEPTSGSVTVDGKAVRGPGLDRGVVFQEFALFPWLTALDNVAFGLKSMGIGRDERRRRANKYVELVGLSAFAQYYPNRLSGGMRQRVGLGRALAVDPAVLLMDEPFGALDALTRENMQGALAEIWQETHKTVLFITHDIEEAVFLSDRVLVLNGRPSALVLELPVALPRPRNRHAADFQAHVGRLEDAIRGQERSKTTEGEVIT